MRHDIVRPVMRLDVSARTVLVVGILVLDRRTVLVVVAVMVDEEGDGSNVGRSGIAGFRVQVCLKGTVAHVHGWRAGEGTPDDELLGTGAESEGVDGDEVECLGVLDHLDVEMGEEGDVEGVEDGFLGKRFGTLTPLLGQYVDDGSEGGELVHGDVSSIRGAG